MARGRIHDWSLIERLAEECRRGTHIDRKQLRALYESKTGLELTPPSLQYILASLREAAR